VPRAREARPAAVRCPTRAADADRKILEGFKVSKDWPLFEVFIRSRSGLEHKHVGSVHAADARMAVEHARDVYTRRQEGVSIWVVRSSDITASDPAEADALFEPARDKVYRHPTFYSIPDEVKNL
jgi:ring-1,2-phenylacetyl-CoA epoxidase subunit PaaB